ncbi:transmembrane protein 26 [Elysia marginata]|uniref:Transmembrane protein 26 n=1 Tax=Elysia marginata TaxID=1093978 RepID=A0AAV4G5M1_9GAST|nr:transmembrane protein 26 [Elysia marginata]
MSASSEMKSSTLARDLCQVFSVFFAILVRLVLAAFCVLTVVVVVDKRQDERFWALTAILILLFIEGVHTVVKRRGQERKWVCLCFACYLLASVPSIWLLELEKLGKFKSKIAETNTSSVQSSLPGGLSTTFQLDSDDIIFILENCLVFLLILCRWLLPKGEITRDQLSQLLFVFIGMASDVMELFQLFEEDKILNDKYMTYVILTVWTISLCQVSRMALLNIPR